MDRDDSPVGRVLSRREVLTVLGASGLALLAGGTHEVLARANSRLRLPACVARPEQTAGPYFVDAKLNRSDIRSDAASGEVKEGAPLDLVLACPLVRAVEVGGARLELGGAGVDSTVGALEALGAVPVGGERPQLPQEPVVDHRRLRDPLQLDPSAETVEQEVEAIG